MALELSSYQVYKRTFLTSVRWLFSYSAKEVDTPVHSSLDQCPCIIVCESVFGDLAGFIEQMSTHNGRELARTWQGVGKELDVASRFLERIGRYGNDSRLGIFDGLMGGFGRIGFDG